MQDEMLERYEKALAKSANPRNLLGVARRFLEYAGDRTLDDSVAEGYVRKLQREGFASASVDWQYRVIRRLYRVNDLSLGMKSPGVKQEDRYAPAIGLGMIEKMVKAVKTWPMDDYRAAFLVLSTTYGFRRAEMVNLTPTSIEGDLLNIETMKGGRQRLHVVPAEIASRVNCYGFKYKVSLSRASLAFLEILEAAGIKPLPDVGWHGIRRSLATFLVERRSLMEVRAFMGWAGPTGDMPQRYWSQSFIEEDGSQKAYSPTWRREIDLEIFKVHPFLEFWR